MNSRLRRPAGALIATAVATSLFGFVPAAHAIAFSVSGTVTGGGAPLGQVYVSAYEQVDGEWVFVETGDGSTVTDEDGTYGLDLPVGDYRFEFQDNSTGDFLGEFYNNAPTVDDALTVEVGADPEVVNVDLAEASHITGTVSAAGLADASELWVQVYERRTNDNGDTSWVGFTGTTAEPNGSYHVGGLEDGLYRVGFEHHPSSELDEDVAYATEFYQDKTTVERSQTLDVSPNNPAEGINAELVPDATISGTVTDATGSPVQGAQVLAYANDGDWSDVAFTRSDAAGRYTLRGLPADTFRVSFGAEVGDDYRYEVWDNAESLDDGQDIVTGANEDVVGKNAQLVEGEFDPLPFLEGVTIPMITGTPQVGSTLSVSKGTWNVAEVSATYQWVNDDGAIVGATSNTYAPTAADLGKTLVVLVDASAPGYQDRTNMSNVVGPITAAPVVTPPVVTPPVATPPAPVISFSKKIDVAGALKVGSTLKLKNFKALVSRATVSYKIQWFAGSKKIKKATKSKLKVTKALKGKKIKVKVSATSGGTTKTVTVKVGKIR